MELYAAIICESTIMDSQTNKLSIMNCIEEIGTTLIPNVYPSFQMVTLWYREKKAEINETKDIRIRILYPNGEEFEKPIEYKFEIPNDSLRHRVIITLSGIPLKVEGNMKFQIEINEGGKWNSIGLVPINVRKVDKIV